MHIHSSQYNYILHGLLEVTYKHTARGNSAWLTGSDVECQVISHDPSVTSMVLMVLNGRKCITYIYYIIKQLLTYVSVDMECY